MNRAGSARQRLPGPSQAGEGSPDMVDDDMACEVPLSQGQVALVSRCDLERAISRRWHVAVSGGIAYAYSVLLMCERAGGKRGLVSMHRWVLEAPPGVVVDHINGNGLDNRRSNLRLCRHAENIRNQRPQIGRSSRFKGVRKRGDKWAAMIQHDGDKIWLGSFDDEERAARQYDRAARVLFGPFARTNAKAGLFSE